jgi:uncharacterized repeat protein (TIGR01451 family)
MKRLIVALFLVLVVGVLLTGCKKQGADSAEIVVERVGVCEHGKKFPPTSSADKNEAIVFTVTVTNKGQNEVENVVISNDLPEGVRLQKGSLTKKVGTLKPGETVNFTFTVNTGEPKSVVFKGTEVKFTVNGTQNVVRTKDLFVDIQATSGC